MVTFEPSRTNTKRRRMKNLLLEFSDRTTAHGIPRVGMATSKRSAAFWMCIFTTSLFIFIFNLSFLVAKFFRFETTTQVELRFETSKFPVVTLCNINPYKHSKIKEVDEMRRMFTLLDQSKTRKAEEEEIKAANRLGRATSEYDKFRYKPLYARCLCPKKDGQCVPFLTAPLPKEQVCICYFDTLQRSPWPCFEESYWSSQWCSKCNPSGNCWEVFKKRELSKNDNAQRCICETFTNKCLAAAGDQVEQIWDPKYKDVRLDRYTTTTQEPPTTQAPTTTTTQPEMAQPWQNKTKEAILEKALGFGGITDETAKVSKAQENTLFIMAEMNNETRVKLSQQKKDFILQCSFNGHQCHIERDFKLYVDPVYGNCYMFNMNSTQSRTTSRAGPIYGLSLVVYVDVDDYLPTTKASGVRIVVHPQEEFPFPDTNGYNAPTGLMSSFGLRLRKIERLPAPFGDCILEGKTKDYIYRDQVYTLEGCYRSCFQMQLIRACGCGDPRFPLPENHRHCKVEEIEKRACLEEITQKFGGLHGTFTEKCECTQPCHQYVYDMSFSAAEWPTPKSRLDECNGTADYCRELYRKNALSLEIYFEQLNYEVLKEQQAYQWVNLMADFGGQLGLWMGVSMITIMEVLVLCYQLFKVCCHRSRRKKMPRQHRRSIYDNSTVEMTIKIQPQTNEELGDSVNTAYTDEEYEANGA